MLTLLRVLCIPLMVGAFYLAGPYAGITSAIIFVFAAITDWLDGWVARTLDQESEFGAFLDPVADQTHTGPGTTTNLILKTRT